MKNKVATWLRLALRNNQDEISKRNTAPQLAETVIIDRNSKQHLQNEVNQKELLQLRKHFRKNKEYQGRSHLICCQARPSSKLYMFVLCVI